MPKKVEDIISNSKRREPSKYFSELARATNKQLGPAREEEASRVEIPYDRRIRPTVVKSPKSGKSLLFAIVVVFVALVFGISIFISGATITIVPKTATLPVDAQFSAVKDGVGDSVLPFQLVAITDQATDTVAGTAGNAVPAKATGTVTLYNNFSTVPQKLVINTRIATTSNLVYFTNTAVTIPGYTKSGSTITPGSVSVAVTAEKTGASYNSAPTDFSIVGFKGTSKAKGFYGRSTSPLAGGTDGAQFGIAPDALATEQQKLSGELKTEITDGLSKQIPEGYVLFPTSVTVTEDPMPTQSAPDPSGNITLTENGAGYAYIFDTAKLTAAVAQKIVAPAPDATSSDDSTTTPDNSDATDDDSSDTTTPAAPDVTIQNLTDLTFAIVPDPTQPSASPNTITDLAFSLTGTANVEWNIDTASVKQGSVGSSKQSVLESLSNNPGITQATVIVRPFWEGKLPKNPDHIAIVVTDPFK